MKYSVFPIVIVLFIQVVALQTVKGVDEPLLPARFSPAKPQEPKEGSLMVLYCGTVTEVTKDSITIQWPGEEKPKKFSVSETLASGGFPTKSRSGIILAGHLIRSSYCYRLADV